jgi:hypothetical protein
LTCYRNEKPYVGQKAEAVQMVTSESVK